MIKKFLLISLIFFINAESAEQKRELLGKEIVGKIERYDWQTYGHPYTRYEVNFADGSNLLCDELWTRPENIFWEKVNCYNYWCLSGFEGKRSRINDAEKIFTTLANYYKKQEEKS